MARIPDLKEFARRFDLTLISIEDLIKYRRRSEVLMTIVPGLCPLG